MHSARLVALADYLLADHLVAEHDPNLPFLTCSRYGLQPGLFWVWRVEPRDVLLEATHQEQQTEDHEGPQDQHREQEQLISGHRAQSCTT